MTDPFRSSTEERRLLHIGRLFAGQAGSQFDLGGGSVEIQVGADARDDCAVLRIQGNFDVVVGSDYVRGAEFLLYERGLLNNFDIGYYLVAANVSDVAAMGALPIAVLSVIRYPKTMDDAAFMDVLAGINSACDALGARNVGGDIGNAERLTLSATAIGAVESGCALLRSSARPGDSVFLTGPTGLAGAAIRALGDALPAVGLDTDDTNSLLTAWRRPVAQVAAGRILSGLRSEVAAADTSDGFKGALTDIAVASQVGIDIDRERFPMHPVVERTAAACELDPWDLAFGDSVDFQLAFTVPRERAGDCTAAFERAELPLFECGTVTPDVGILRLVDANGDAADLPGLQRHQD